MTEYQQRREEVDITGRCYNCKRMAVPGNIRCQVHIQINRLRSLAWRTKNPEARDQLRQVWKDQGRCEICPEHRALRKGKLHCDPCLERFRGYYETRKEEGMCARLGCPNLAQDGYVHCRGHHASEKSRQQYASFIKTGKTLTLPSGLTIGAR